jgi:hypothetical protein
MIEHLLHPRIKKAKIGQPFYLSWHLLLLPSLNLFMKIDLDFMNLIFSDKYAKVYRDGSH